MTDLLLSELVALLLLLPVLLRPFSRYLKKEAAIPILPFIGLFVCICIAAGQGIVLILFILILFTLIVCISEMMRLVAFSQGMVNDFYGIASIILRAVLLILFGGTAYLIFRFAPESSIKTGYPLTIRNTELTETASPVNPIKSILIERQGGADKKALVIVAETFPSSNRPGTIAALLADKGYTVLEIIQLNHRDIIPRAPLYGKLLPLAGKKEHRFLSKEADPQTAVFFSKFIENAVTRYGGNKRLFLYAEGVYTDLAAQFCTEYPGIFTGVFFCLSEEEPLPQIPEGWANIIREEDGQAAAGTESLTEPAIPAPASSDRTAAAGETASRETMHSAPTSTPDTAVQSMLIASEPLLPFCCYIRPYSELAGFGALRAEDILAAELLGSSRSLGRKDKTAAAAAFDRYAVLF